MSRNIAFWPVLRNTSNAAKNSDNIIPLAMVRTLARKLEVKNTPKQDSHYQNRKPAVPFLAYTKFQWVTPAFFVCGCHQLVSIALQQCTWTVFSDVLT